MFECAFLRELACSRLSLVGSEKKGEREKNEGGLRRGRKGAAPRLSSPSFFSRSSPTTESLEQAIRECKHISETELRNE